MESYTVRRRWPSLLMIWGGMTWGCAVAPSCPPSDAIPVSARQVSAPLAFSGNFSTTALEQKVKSQEERIAELSLQLRMLKRIDLDGQKER
jgi:hypothetical protein